MSFFPSEVYGLFGDAKDSDITVISSDSVAFKLHKKYLDAATGQFPKPEVDDAKDKPMLLEEPARVLAIVFQFTYPKKHPKMNDQEFDTIMAVAEAVEKYQVYPAMNTCEARLIKYLPGRSIDQAAEILGFAIKYDYPDLIHAAVPHLSRAPLMPVAQKLPPSAVLSWYQEEWRSVFDKAFQHVNSIAHNRNGNECSTSKICIACRYSLITRITELERLETLSALVASLEIKTGEDRPFPDYRICNPCPNNTCRYLGEVYDICKKGIKNMPLFTDILFDESLSRVAN